MEKMSQKKPWEKAAKEDLAECKEKDNLKMQQ